MQTSISVIPVTSVAPTSATAVSQAPLVAPVSLFEDVIERVTPPLEFRDWMAKLKTYGDAARSTEPPEPASVAKTAPAAPEPTEAAHLANPVHDDRPAPDAAQPTPQVKAE
ncbi:hypothetical protein [uncultured Paracoccus sp.]|uniref:hypothetical protein n=1 Tax=uncultured Paracoccus sp. TaxID=189685 RepID=UPI0025E6F8B3|nr:hypothetical protein [uncultured Paracoccus sp.]